jgi:outer membrane beta-barrel protein
MEDFDELGGNIVLKESAQALQPETRIEVVQNRVVNRSLRSEISSELGNVIGGDTFLVTKNLSLQYQLHLSANWSLGFSYSYAHNELNREGKRLIANENLIPALDYPRETTLAVINWYPIYGKLNLLNQAIVQYDVYLLAGAGNINLRSGTAPVSSLGVGLGMWFSQHLTGRLELRRQMYDAKIVGEQVPMGTTVAGMSLGYLL